MCQATAYLIREGKEEELMREVTFLEVAGEGILLATFFAEPRLVPAKVASVDFLKHIVKLIPLTKENCLPSVDEQDKLRLLLPHWIEHNQEHAAEFRQWAAKAGPAQADILTAATNLEAVNEALAKALEKLGGHL